MIFSNDSDFLNVAVSGVSHRGIVYCHQQSRSIGDIIRSLELMWEVLEPQEMHERVEFI